MIRLTPAGMDGARRRDLRAPHLHPPRNSGDRGGQSAERRVVWIAFSWDMAATRLRRVAPGAEDLGSARVSGWSSCVADGRIVAVRTEGAALWGRAWRIDEAASAALAHRRHPAGVIELVVATDELGRPLDVRLLAFAEASASARPSLLESGWAIFGAAEIGLPRHRRIRPLPVRRSPRTTP